MLDRRSWLHSALGTAAAIVMAGPVSATGFFARKLVVYKSPTCGCCSKWIDHVKAAKFEVVVNDVDNIGLIKQKNGVPPELASCHTCLIDGYVIEGHVPADVIEKLLTEKPKIRGIAVPGMPVGSPGMEMGSRKDRYNVIAFDNGGKTSIFAKR